MALNRDTKYYRENLVSIDDPMYEVTDDMFTLLYEGSEPEFAWIKESTHLIYDWSNVVRSSYVRWAVGINGLHVAATKYEQPLWSKTHQFSVGGLKTEGQTVVPRPLLLLTGDQAAKIHKDTISVLASYGLIDLYSLLEEFILRAFRIYWSHHPEEMIKGHNNKEGRKLFRDREQNPNAWSQYWEERLDSWQRKKVYKPIDEVLLSYYRTADLIDETTKESYVLNLSKNLKVISLIRNALVHGEGQVSDQLATAASQSIIFNDEFKRGDTIVLSATQLMKVEHYAQGLLAVVNTSLMQQVVE